MRIITLFTLFLILLPQISDAQTIDELKEQRNITAEQQKELQRQVDSLAKEIASLNDQIVKLSGWQTGLNGQIGLSFAKNSQWQSIDNDNSSSAFNLGITATANKNADAFYWNNKAILIKEWQDVDKLGEPDNDDLFDRVNSTADLINVASLYGYKLSEKFAISALGELNTSFHEFMERGTLDFGVGASWIPAPKLVIVMHPLNYHYSFGEGGESVVGAKIRADYTQDITVAGKGIALSSTFTSFLPYKDVEPTLFNWTWLNNFSFSIWKGVGVGFGFGLRGADAEVQDETQYFYTFGLSYNI